MYAASMGRKVVAVEPFYDSYIRLHKSSILNNVTNQIILINNAISNRRGELKKLSFNGPNIGGQRLELNENFVQQSNDERLNIDAKRIEANNENRKYFITTILLDDLVTVLPINEFNEAIMKIDIENFEIKAFEKAEKLFNRVHFYAIFMEWINKSNYLTFSKIEIENFIQFFYSRGK